MRSAHRPSLPDFRHAARRPRPRSARGRRARRRDRCPDGRDRQGRDPEVERRHAARAGAGGHRPGRGGRGRGPRVADHPAGRPGPGRTHRAAARPPACSPALDGSPPRRSWSPSSPSTCPGSPPRTVARLTWAVEASAAVDGAVLVDAGRAAGSRSPRCTARPRWARPPGRPASRSTACRCDAWSAGCDSTEVPTVGDEARDVDTWADLRDLSGPDRGRLPDRLSSTTLGRVTLHDWIDELCDVLDVEPRSTRRVILDLARDAAHGVQRTAAPITTYLLGYAAALAGGSPETVEELAGRAIGARREVGRRGGQPRRLRGRARRRRRADLVEAD